MISTDQLSSANQMLRLLVPSTFKGLPSKSSITELLCACGLVFGKEHEACGRDDISMEEGVIKFSSEHEQVTLGAREHGALATKLDAWRSIFVDLSILGQDSTRYQGAGFGNLSGRIGAPSTPKGRRHFLISGTQTGHLQSLGLAGLCRVQSYQPEQNRVVSAGPLAPSSESMTHGAIYDLSPAIRFVFHVHAPKLWSEGGRLGLPTTRADVQYGTRAMAREVARLYRETSLSERRVFAMAGHEDGVISFGRNAEEAGLVLVCELARARQL